MEYVEYLIRRINRRFSSAEEAYMLEKEVLDFLNSQDTPIEQKKRLKNEAYLEALAILSDGYMYKNKLEHYRTQKK